jgi:hypothetical protein
MLMCFMRELTSVVFVASAMALWLSHQMVVGRLGFEPRSMSIFCNQMDSCAACMELTYSASVHDRVGVVWALLLHVRVAPAIINTYPLVDFCESMSPAQSVSLNPCTIADILSPNFPLYMRERSCVPFR